MNTLLKTAVAALFAAAPATVALADEPAPIRIGFQTGEINVLLTYALETGLFEKEGLSVTLSGFPAGPAMLPALAASEIDVAWMGEVPAVTGYSNGLPIEILFMERLDYTNVRLVVNPDSGVTDVAGLRGKSIGVALGSTSHYHTLQALDQAGLPVSDVTLVNLSPANMPPAYVAGQIDAAFVWEPNVGIMEREGAVAIANTRSIGLFTGGIWVTRKGFSGGSPEALNRFLTAWDKAQKDYAADPAGVRAHEAKRLDMTAEAFDALIAGQSVEHPSFERNLTAELMGPPGSEFDSGLMVHLRNIGDFLVAQQRISQTPADWTGLFNTAPIQAVVAAQ